MPPAIANDQDDGPPIGISLFQQRGKSASFLCTAQKSSSFKMGWQPLNH